MKSILFLLGFFSFGMSQQSFIIQNIQYNPEVSNSENLQTPCLPMGQERLSASNTPQNRTLKNECLLKIGEQEFEVNHLYALSIPEPFDENKKMIRLVCTSQELDEGVLTDEIQLHQALYAEGQKGFFLDLKKDGSAAMIRLNWEDWSTMWSGAVNEIHFEGDINEDKIKGKISTEPALSIFGKETQWWVTMDLNLKISGGW